jgi:hypothetical protein
VTIEQLILSALITAVISMDVSRTLIFRPFRQFVKGWHWGYKLVCCPWCFSHWVVLPLVFYFTWNLLYVFVVVGLAAVPMIAFDYLFERLDRFHED